MINPEKTKIAVLLMSFLVGRGWGATKTGAIRSSWGGNSVKINQGKFHIQIFI
jgi:hypothetical protein